MRYLLSLLAAATMTNANAQIEIPPIAHSFVLTTSPVAGKASSNIFIMTAVAPKPTMVATRDHESLLVLIPLRDEMWELQRVTNWESGEPKIERIALEGDPLRDRNDYLQSWIALRPDGKFATIQLFSYNLKKFERRVVIFTVDLQTFTVVARKASTDAAMANSRFKFVDDETILAAQGPSSSMKGVRTLTNEYIQPDVLVMNAVGPGSHDAALLAFPSFNMQSICHYEIEALTKPDGVASGSRDDPDTWWSPQGSGLIRAKSAEPACEPIFSAARVAAPAEMPGPMDASHPHAERQLGPQCQLEDIAPTMALGMFNCRTGHNEKGRGFHTDHEFERIVSEPDGVNKLLIELKPWTSYSAVLGRANSHNFVVFLRPKLKVEVYSVP